MIRKKKQIIVIFSVLVALIALLIGILIETIKVRQNCYEYYKNGEFGTSNNCVYKNGAYCEIGNKIEKVDLYYEEAK